MGTRRASSRRPAQAPEIPRGVEVLVKKASVDAEFKGLLLDKRAEAANEIGLELDPAEVMMLKAVPRAQLEAIIARTSVRPETRRAFLGRAAAVMLAALGAGVVSGCGDDKGWQVTRGHSSVPVQTKGIQPDRPKKVEPTDGIRPDRPETREVTD